MGSADLSFSGKMFMILYIYLSLFNGPGEGSVLEENQYDWTYVVSTLNGEVLSPKVTLMALGFTQPRNLMPRINYGVSDRDVCKINLAIYAFNSIIEASLK
eukprot:TRINITY_DN8946_c0_g1_i1.p2 TRINITY_DN8946_c0_g1~~TRINITY_DN8946_c0_g1_i1.p2  ORF type:complete len:109 (-),score=14.35 TRINITY_DN8946_c0_g1_i1:367-669(-)